jgi:hypothetical protein
MAGTQDCPPWHPALALMHEPLLIFYLVLIIIHREFELCSRVWQRNREKPDGENIMNRLS